MARKQLRIPVIIGTIQIPGNASKGTWDKALLFGAIYSYGGLVLGLMCILGGLALFVGGATATTNWVAHILGSTSEISDASPGAVLFIVGLFIVLVTRFDIEVKD